MLLLLKHLYIKKKKKNIYDKIENEPVQLQYTNFNLFLTLFLQIMSQQIGKILALIAALFLAHSAYSTYERKEMNIPCFDMTISHVFIDLAYIKAVDEIDTSLPIEVKKKKQ